MNIELGDGMEHENSEIHRQNRRNCVEVWEKKMLHMQTIENGGFILLQITWPALQSQTKCGLQHAQDAEGAILVKQKLYYAKERLFTDSTSGTPNIQFYQ